MKEVTLPSRHRIQNLGPRGLRPSTLPLGHRGSPQHWMWEWIGKKQFVSLKIEYQIGGRTCNLRLSKQAVFNHCARAPAWSGFKHAAISYQTFFQCLADVRWTLYHKLLQQDLQHCSLQRQTAVTAYFSSKQLLLLAFALKRTHHSSEPEKSIGMELVGRFFPQDDRFAGCACRLSFYIAVGTARACLMTPCSLAGWPPEAAPTRLQRVVLTWQLLRWVRSNEHITRKPLIYQRHYDIHQHSVK